MSYVSPSLTHGRIFFPPHPPRVRGWRRMTFQIILWGTITCSELRNKKFKLNISIAFLFSVCGESQMSANPWWDHLLSMATLAGCGESNQICMVHCSTPHGRYHMFCLHSTSTFAKVFLFWRRWRVLVELQGDLRASLLQVYQPQYLVHGFPGFCISELDATFLCNKVDGSWVDRYVTLFLFFDRWCLRCKEYLFFLFRYATKATYLNLHIGKPLIAWFSMSRYSPPTNLFTLVLYANQVPFCLQC